MGSSSGLAASGTLESTGDVSFEAVIPAGLPRRVQCVQLATVPREEWPCCGDSWCHPVSSWLGLSQVWSVLEDEIAAFLPLTVSSAVPLPHLRVHPGLTGKGAQQNKHAPCCR